MDSWTGVTKAQGTGGIQLARLTSQRLARLNMKPR